MQSDTQFFCRLESLLRVAPEIAFRCENRKGFVSFDKICWNNGRKMIKAKSQQVGDKHAWWHFEAVAQT